MIVVPNPKCKEKDVIVVGVKYSARPTSHPKYPE
jgi:hypothetical protein